MILFMILGFCYGFFLRLYLVDDVLLPIIIILVDDLIFNFATYVIFFLMRNRLEFATYLKDIILPEMIYTALITLIVFKFFAFVNKTLKKMEKASE